MSTSITSSFIAQYEAAVHEAYQQKGSKLRNMVRLRTGVTGSTCIFQATGKGAAGSKTRHGNVPLMNATHSTVTATLADYYAADYVDKLDELKTNIDERMVVANNGAAALGRKIDALLITAMEGNNAVSVGSTGLTKTKIFSAFETLNGNDVPDDGQRFCVVGPHQWNELLNIAEFKSSDYVGAEYPWLKGTESKKWLGIVWTMHTGLTLSSTTRKCLMWHSSAIGLAEGQGITSVIDWVPEKAAYLIDHMMSAGAIAIDTKGIVEIDCLDTATIA